MVIIADLLDIFLKLDHVHNVYQEKVKVLIADLLNIFLKLHPTRSLLPLPTVAVDLPVQTNLNDLQFV